MLKIKVHFVSNAICLTNRKHGLMKTVQLRSYHPKTTCDLWWPVFGQSCIYGADIAIKSIIRICWFAWIKITKESKMEIVKQISWSIKIRINKFINWLCPIFAWTDPDCVTIISWQLMSMSSIKLYEMTTKDSSKSPNSCVVEQLQFNSVKFDKRVYNF